MQFIEDEAKSLFHEAIKPAIAAGLVLGYEYYNGRNNYNNSIQSHLKSAGIVAGAVFGSDFVLKKISIGSDNVKGLEQTLLKPVATGAMYALGRKYMLNKPNFVMDAAVGGATCLASGYLGSPIDKFF